MYGHCRVPSEIWWRVHRAQSRQNAYVQTCHLICTNVHVSILRTIKCCGATVTLYVPVTAVDQWLLILNLIYTQSKHPLFPLIPLPPLPWVYLFLHLFAHSMSLTHLFLLLSDVSQPTPDHNLFSWQIWNKKIDATQPTTTRRLCHASLHVNFDKPDTLGAAIWLPLCHITPSVSGLWSSPQCFFKDVHLVVSPPWQPCPLNW